MICEREERRGKGQRLGRSRSGLDWKLRLKRCLLFGADTVIASIKQRRRLRSSCVLRLGLLFIFVKLLRALSDFPRYLAPVPTSLSLSPLESCLSKTSFTHVAYANQL